MFAFKTLYGMAHPEMILLFLEFERRVDCIDLTIMHSHDASFFPRYEQLFYQKSCFLEKTTWKILFVEF